MDEGYKLLLKSQASAIVRAALYLASGILLRKGYISRDMDATEANQLVGFALGGASLTWAMYDNHRKHKETVAALALPSGATRDDLTRSLTGK